MTTWGAGRQKPGCKQHRQGPASGSRTVDRHGAAISSRVKPTSEQHVEMDRAGAVLAHTHLARVPQRQQVQPTRHLRQRDGRLGQPLRKGGSTLRRLLLPLRRLLRQCKLKHLDGSSAGKTTAQIAVQYSRCAANCYVCLHIALHIRLGGRGVQPGCAALRKACNPPPASRGPPLRWSGPPGATGWPAQCWTLQARLHHSPPSCAAGCWSRPPVVRREGGKGA